MAKAINIHMHGEVRRETSELGSKVLEYFSRHPTEKFTADEIANLVDEPYAGVKVFLLHCKYDGTLVSSINPSGREVYFLK